MIKFWLCFVPLFVAVDCIGVLPIFLGMVEGMKREMIKKIIIQSTITAFVVALSFLVIGKGVMGLLGITVADFMIAGGTLLFVISLNDILSVDRKRYILDVESLGAVPLGFPLIVGPAVLTTSILLVDQYGIIPTVLAIIVNILIAGLVFSYSYKINRILGKTGAKTISKISNLLLSAIGVMMVRKGIQIYLNML